VSAAGADAGGGFARWERVPRRSEVADGTASWLGTVVSWFGGVSASVESAGLPAIGAKRVGPTLGPMF
jgi:hypothetical protein